MIRTTSKLPNDASTKKGKGEILNASHVKHGLKVEFRDLPINGNGALKQGALVGAEVEAVMSICRHSYAFFRDEESLKEALKNVIKDSSSAGLKGAGIAALSAGTKGALESSAYSSLQGLGNSALPVVIATVAVEVGMSLKKLYNGELTGEECWEEIKGKTPNLVGSIVGASIGQTVIPVPMVGAMVGSLIGTIVASFTMNVLTQNKRVAANHQRRLEIEAQCAELKEQIHGYRMAIGQMQKQYMEGYSQTFDMAFDIMAKAVVADDIDGFIAANNLIIAKCGGTVQFSSMNEFDDIMNSNQSFKL